MSERLYFKNTDKRFDKPVGMGYAVLLHCTAQQFPLIYNSKSLQFKTKHTWTVFFYLLRKVRALLDHIQSRSFTHLARKKTVLFVAHQVLGSSQFQILPTSANKVLKTEYGKSSFFRKDLFVDITNRLEIIKVKELFRI